MCQLDVPIGHTHTYNGANSAWTSDENFLVGLCRNIEN